jgi:hypothetical protein
MQSATLWLKKPQGVPDHKIRWTESHFLQILNTNVHQMKEIKEEE